MHLEGILAVLFQAGLVVALQERLALTFLIFLCLPPQCWDYRYVPRHGRPAVLIICTQEDLCPDYIWRNAETTPNDQRL